MESKHINDLKVDDVLKRKSNNESCFIKQIIEDNEDKQKNFGFDGFFVKEKVMRKFFYNERSKILIYNKKI